MTRAPTGATVTAQRAILAGGLPMVTATLILLMLAAGFGLPLIPSGGWQPVPTASVAAAFNTHVALRLRTDRVGLRHGGADCTTDATDC